MLTEASVPLKRKAPPDTPGTYVRAPLPVPAPAPVPAELLAVPSPLHQPTRPGTATVAEVAASPRPMAELPGGSEIVGVGPPFQSRGPSLGSTVEVTTEAGSPAALTTTLCPPEAVPALRTSPPAF